MMVLCIILSLALVSTAPAQMKKTLSEKAKKAERRSKQRNKKQP